MNNDLEFINKSIDECIYTIRNYQVMLDSDIAFFFGVETKNLNRQMKRNIDRFPEDFCFQLSLDEYKNLRCQNVTSSYGGRRYLPYAYTEHGIIALAGILTSDIASRMSVEIVRKFVQMRKFILENGDLLLTLAKIQNRQLEFENETNLKFDKVFKSITKLDLPNTALFYDGQWYDAFDYIVKIVLKANNSIILIDPYCDEKALKILKHKKNDVAVTICKGTNSKLNKDDVDVFELQYGKINIYVNDSIHDRFLIIDNEDCYSLGTSINYAGKKLFTINKILDSDIISSIVKLINRMR